jgi:hypothetical protein
MQDPRKSTRKRKMKQVLFMRAQRIMAQTSNCWKLVFDANNANGMKCRGDY